MIFVAVSYSKNYLIVLFISTETPMYLSFANRPFVGSLVILSEKPPPKRLRFEMIHDNSTSPWYKIQFKNVHLLENDQQPSSRGREV